MDHYHVCRNKYWNKNTKWFPRALIGNDITVGRNFIRSYCTDQRARERLGALSDLFLEINTTFFSADELIEGLVGQWIAAGLAAGTMETYWNIVEFHLPRSTHRHQARKAIERFHALADTKHAPDLTFTEVMKLVENLLSTSVSPVVMVAELVLKTGLRVADITWLTPASFVFSRGHITITVRLAKNRQCRSDRRSVTIPLWFGNVSVLTRRFLASAQKGSFVFNQVTATKVNYALRQSIFKKATSYTLRRAFIRKALEVCEYDVEKAARDYTLHHRSKTLLAHYVPDAEARKLGLVSKTVAARRIKK